MSLQDLADDAAILHFDAQARLTELLGDAGWDVDLTAPSITYQTRPQQTVLPVQLIGSVAQAAGTWMWGWNNVNGFPQQAIELASRVRSFVRDGGPESLSSPVVKTADTEPLVLVLAAKALTRSRDSVVVDAAPGVQVHLMVQAGADSDTTAVRATKAILDTLDAGVLGDHRRALHAYAARTASQLRSVGTSSFELDTADGVVDITLDDAGRILVVRVAQSSQASSGVGAVPPPTAAADTPVPDDREVSEAGSVSRDAEAPDVSQANAAVPGSAASDSAVSNGAPAEGGAETHTALSDAGTEAAPDADVPTAPQSVAPLGQDASVEPLDRLAPQQPAASPQPAPVPVVPLASSTPLTPPVVPSAAPYTHSSSTERSSSDTASGAAVPETTGQRWTPAAPQAAQPPHPEAAPSAHVTPERAPSSTPSAPWQPFDASPRWEHAPAAAPSASPGGPPPVPAPAPGEGAARGFLPPHLANAPGQHLPVPPPTQLGQQYGGQTQYGGQPQHPGQGQHPAQPPYPAQPAHQQLPPRPGQVPQQGPGNPAQWGAHPQQPAQPWQAPSWNGQPNDSWQHPGASTQQFDGQGRPLNQYGQPAQGQQAQGQQPPRQQFPGQGQPAQQPPQGFAYPGQQFSGQSQPFPGQSQPGQGQPFPGQPMPGQHGQQTGPPQYQPGHPQQHSGQSPQGAGQWGQPSWNGEQGAPGQYPARPAPSAFPAPGHQERPGYDPRWPGNGQPPVPPRN